MWYSGRMDKYIYVELKEIADKVGIRFYFVNRRNEVTNHYQMIITSVNHYNNEYGMKVGSKKERLGEWIQYKAKVPVSDWYKYHCKLKDVL